MSKDKCKHCGSKNTETVDHYTDDHQGKPIIKEVVTCKDCYSVLEKQ